MNYYRHLGFMNYYRLWGFMNYYRLLGFMLPGMNIAFRV